MDCYVLQYYPKDVAVGHRRDSTEGLFSPDLRVPTQRLHAPLLSMDKWGAHAGAKPAPLVSPSPIRPTRLREALSSSAPTRLSRVGRAD
eukprot:6195887-Pleurochrysis_carterae.AAC.5